MDKAELLLSGAVDYITKPFDRKELLARISVQFRNTSVIGTTTVLRFDDITMDFSSHTVLVLEDSVRLTKTEYAILKLLMQHPTQVITKSILL